MWIPRRASLPAISGPTPFKKRTESVKEAIAAMLGGVRHSSQTGAALRPAGRSLTDQLISVFAP